MSKSQYITLSSAISIYNVLFEHIERLLDDQSNYFCPIPEIRAALNKGYEKLKSYQINVQNLLQISKYLKIKNFCLI